MTRRRSGSLLTALVLGAGVVLLAGSMSWVDGVSASGIVGSFGGSSGRVTGSDLTPGLSALALVGVAAAAAAVLTSGPVRRAAAGCGALAGVAAAVLAVRVGLDPGAAVESVVAAGAAQRTGTVATSWPPIGLAIAGALAMVAGGGGILGGRQPSVPTARDRAASDAERSRDRGADTDWDRLSRGDDPTA